MLTAREGELPGEARGALDAHLAGCAGCRARAADLAATDGLFAEALLAAASRRDFATFADGVMERVAAGSRPSAWSRLRRWAHAHRAAAAAAALAPTLAAAALVVYFATGGAPAPTLDAIDVVAEGRGAMVLQTSEGPVVLLGDPEGS
jgi:anti-sigma factor RsiW